MRQSYVFVKAFLINYVAEVSGVAVKLLPLTAALPDQVFIIIMRAEQDCWILTCLIYCRDYCNKKHLLVKVPFLKGGFVNHRST